MRGKHFVTSQEGIMLDNCTKKSEKKIMRFPEIIKDIRCQGLLSQTDFAKELGVSYSTVNRWETGKTLPTYKAMKSIEAFCSRHNIEAELCIELWKGEK